MTNFEKISSSKEEMAYWMMCPYGNSGECYAEESDEKTCIECCLEWLGRESEE